MPDLASLILKLKAVDILQNNVGLMSTDTVNSDLGIECRTPFVRKTYAVCVSSPINKLINFDPKFRANKVPPRKIY